MGKTTLRIQEIQLNQREILSLVAKVENWEVIGRWDDGRYDNRYTGSIGDLTLELSHHLTFYADVGCTLDVKRDNSLLGSIYDRVSSTPQLVELYRTLEDKQQERYEQLKKTEEDLRKTEEENRKLAEKEKKRKEERLNRLKEIKNIEYALSLI